MLPKVVHGDRTIDYFLYAEYMPFEYRREQTYYRSIYLMLCTVVVNYLYCASNKCVNYASQN